MLTKAEMEQAEAWFLQGNKAFLENNISEALHFYQQAASLRPDSGLVWQNIAACYQAQGNIESAIDALDMAVKRNPKAYDARLSLAQAYLEHYQLGKAQLHFFELLQIPEYRAASHAGLGVILMRQNKWYAAIDELTAAAKFCPDDLDTLVNLATCHMKQQHITEAISLLQQVKAKAPDHAIANYRLAALTGESVPDRAPSAYITALFDHYADYFDTALMQHLQYQGPEKLLKLWRKLEMQTKVALAYDLGCGTGLMGKMMAPYCEKMVGVDLSSRMLSQAEQQGCYHELYQGDLLMQLQALAPADLHIAADTFCYLGDLLDLIKLIARKTQAGGYLLFSTEHAASGTFHLQQNGRYQHSVAYMEELAKLTGFSCLQHETAVLRLEQGQEVFGDFWLWGKTLR